MKIGIDIRTAADPFDGKSVYTWNLVRELLRLDQNNEYILYTNRLTEPLAHFNSSQKSEAGNTEINLIPARGLFWHFAVIKDFVKRTGQKRAQNNFRTAEAPSSPDALFFSPTSFIIPAFLPKRIASIITVHDLVAFLHPNLHETKAAILEKLFLGRALKRARRVLVPSENTKKDLMRIFQYPAEKICVTPLGVEGTRSAQRETRLPAGQARNVRKKYGLPDEFILTVANLSPRKNVDALVDAFLRVIASPKSVEERLPVRQAGHEGSNPALVIVGGRAWRSEKLLKKIAQHPRLIIHLEHVAREDLPALYQNAKVLVYPSLYEGFGLPPLEAMEAGCPVICSNASSLPEVCGDAALFFDPKNPTELAEAITKVLTDEKLRDVLKHKGLKQAKKFSWRRTAELTLSAFSSRACAGPGI